MPQVNLNGKLIGAETAHVPIVNRALSFGDGIFETLRVFSGQIPFLPYHYNRMMHGLQQLAFNVPAEWTLEFMQTEVRKILQQKGNYRIRMTVWRAGGGLYLPQSQQPRFLVESAELPEPTFVLSANGLAAEMSQTATLARQPWSVCKTLNAIPYVLAAIEKKKRGLDELLLGNDLEEIAEASAANLFLIQKGQVFTPDLSSGCIGGVLRQIVLEILEEEGIPFVETPVLKEDMMQAEAVFLTNSITGVRWLRQFEGQSYSMHPIIQTVHDALIRRVEAAFEV